MEPERIGKYLRARSIPVPVDRKTGKWEIVSNHGDVLGLVAWFGRWRQYTFDPWPGSTFNRDCLIDIAEFLKRINDKKRESK